MNLNEEKLFIKNVKCNNAFKRLKKVTTMLPPPATFTNRYTHTEDVIKIATDIENMLAFGFGLNPIRNFLPACVVHDIGHCCFAHETEVVLNKFIASKLRILEDEVCFSHAVNGALILGIMSNPSKYQTNFSKKKYFSEKKYKDDIKIIVDSMIKHSFKSNFLNSEYFSFIESQYNYETGKTLLRKTRNNRKPLYETGYYVRVADDIASKNSDVMDLIKLYFNIKLTRRSSNYYKIANGYIAQIYKDIKSGKTTNFNIEDVLVNNPNYIAQKNMLKQSYNFPYKKQLTKEAQNLVSSVVEAVYLEPLLFKYCGKNNKLAHLRSVFEAYTSGFPSIRQFSQSNAKLLERYYLINVVSKNNIYKKAYSRYICAIAYQISNFDDVELIEFALLINRHSKIGTNICIGRKLYSLYKNKITVKNKKKK